MHHLSDRRSILVTAVAALAAPRPGSAQPSWPQRPVRIVVPFPAGGATDVVTRMLAQHLSDTLARPFVVENRPGAGATIGSDVVAKAEADGHTFLCTTSALATAPALYARLPFRVPDDFRAVSVIGRVPLVLAVGARSPYHSLADIIADARARPGHLNYASPGSGTPVHLATERLLQKAGINVVHVPYRGVSEMIADMLSGSIAFAFDSPIGVIPQARDGLVRAIAVSSSARLPQLPDVPTVREQLPGNDYEAVVWYGLFLPARAPAGVAEAMAAHVASWSARPEVRERLLALGVVPDASTPAGFAAELARDIATWGAVARAVGARLD